VSAAVGAPTDARIRLTGILVNATYNLQPASAARGYFLAGIGFYDVKYPAPPRRPNNHRAVILSQGFPGT